MLSGAGNGVVASTISVDDGSILSGSTGDRA